MLPHGKASNLSELLLGCFLFYSENQNSYYVPKKKIKKEIKRKEAAFQPKCI
jgi:hypothetical protein